MVSDHLGHTYQAGCGIALNRTSGTSVAPIATARSLALRPFDFPERRQ